MKAIQIVAPYQMEYVDLPTPSQEQMRYFSEYGLVASVTPT